MNERVCVPTQGWQPAAMAPFHPQAQQCCMTVQYVPTNPAEPYMCIITCDTTPARPTTNIWFGTILWAAPQEQVVAEPEQQQPARTNSHAWSPAAGKGQGICATQHTHTPLTKKQPDNNSVEPNMQHCRRNRAHILHLFITWPRLS